MTVVHIAYRYGLNNTGGAMIAATRLHQALLARGVDSHFVCIWKDEEGTNVHQLPTGWLDRRLFLLLTKITRCVWKFSCHRKSIPLNIIPLLGLERLLKRINPDVVHVHWIYSDVCSFEQLAGLPYRLVFSLHDLYILNGFDFHPGKDNRFVVGFTRGNSTWLEVWLFNRKRTLVKQNVIQFIAPSEWSARMCRSSLIGNAVPVAVIGNIPVRMPNVRQCVPSEIESGARFVILWGALGGRDNPFKGFDDLERALTLLPEDVKQHSELRVFGEMAPEIDTAGVLTHFLGELKTIDGLSAAYADADVFAFSSKLETQGMTKIEALLNGVPVVAFDRTACAEGLVDGHNAFVVAAGDYAGFAAGLVHYYNEWKVGRLAARRRSIAEEASQTFSAESICESVLRVYGETS